MVDWSDLPADIVSRIADAIVAARDLIAFKSTCKSWKTIVLCNPRVPTLFYLDSERSLKSLDQKNVGLYFKNQSSTWGSSCDWIFMDNRLVNPLTKAIIFLPKINSNSNVVIKKALVFKKPFSWNVCGCDTDNRYNDLLIMLIYTHRGKVCLTMPGFTKWFFLPNTVDVADLVCFENRVYAIDKIGNLMLLTCNIDNEITIGVSSLAQHTYLPDKQIQGLFLVESDGELLMIVKKGSLPFFKVYKFSFKKKKWLSIDSLGSRAVFVGTNYSMSVFAPEDDERNFIKGNCIYFTRHPAYQGKSFLSIFDMKNKIMIPQHSGKEIECYDCFWLIPKLS